MPSIPSFSGTAGNPYSTPAGWTAYGNTLKYATTTTISNGSFEFSQLMADDALTDVVTVTAVINCNISGWGEVGPAILNSSLSGFNVFFRPDQDQIWVREQVAGASSTIIDNATALGLTTGAHTVVLTFNPSTNAVSVTVDGVLKCSGTYAGGATSLKAGVQLDNAFGGSVYQSFTSINVSVAGGGAVLSTLSSPVSVGGTGYSGTTTGMGAVTSLTNATINSASAGSFSFSMNSFSNGVAYLPMGSQTFTAGDGSLTATKASTVQTMSGYTSVLLSTMNTGTWSLGKDPAFISGNTVHLPTAAGTLNTDGTLTDYVFGSYTGWMQDQADNKMYSFTLTVTDSGLSTGSCMPSIGILAFFSN